MYKQQAKYNLLIKSPVHVLQCTSHYCELLDLYL